MNTVRHRAAAVVSALLAIVAATLLLPALLRPAAAFAAAPGFDLKLTGVPATFTAGADAKTIAAVVSAGDVQRCQRVRWSLTVRVDGAKIDQARIERIAETGGSPLRVRTNGDTARITDVLFDPKMLCAGRTVQAGYKVSFTGNSAGTVTFQAQALDAAGRPLQAATASSRIVREEVARPTEPTATPSPTESEPAVATPSPIAPVGAGDDSSAPPIAAAPAGDTTAGRRASSSSGIPNLLGPGLIVGAVLVFAGVALLLRVRLRARGEKRAAARQQMAMQYYPMR
jgi:hypothetical protein